MANLFRAGKSGRLAIGGGGPNAGQQLAQQHWNTTFDATELETSNFESQKGKRSWLIGLQGLAWGTGALWNAGQNPMANPPGLYMRDDGTSMYIVTNTTDNLFWSLPTWMCSNSTMRCDVTGLVSFEASGKGNDDFTFSGTQI